MAVADTRTVSTPAAYQASRPTTRPPTKASSGTNAERGSDHEVSCDWPRWFAARKAR